jgi:hypothetical protein
MGLARLGDGLGDLPAIVKIDGGLQRFADSLIGDLRSAGCESGVRGACSADRHSSQKKCHRQ